MTIADRLAADFHLSPSNIPVAPLDAAGVYPRGDLVVYRAGARAELFCADPLFALGTEQHDLVPHLDLAASTPKTQASIVTLPSSGRLRPRIRASALPDSARLYPSAYPTGTVAANIGSPAL